MERYIGLDAHSQTCTFAVMGPSGKRLREQVLETNGKVLVDFVKSIAGKKYVCLEEGTHSEWLYELLKPHVDEIVVVQPLRNAGQKNDSIDAWGLADQMRKGSTGTTVFKAPGTYSELRSAVRAHRALVGDMVRAKNRLKAIYRSRENASRRGRLYSILGGDSPMTGAAIRVNVAGGVRDRLRPARRAAAFSCSAITRGMRSRRRSETWEYRVATASDTSLGTSAYAPWARSWRPHSTRPSSGSLSRAWSSTATAILDPRPRSRRSPTRLLSLEMRP